MLQRRGAVVAALGTAQTLAWASSYYLPAVLAAPMARSLDVGVPTVFAAFSAALAVSALAGPWAGRAIDRLGGRPVLMGSNAVFALGLLALGMARDVWTLFAAWALMGLAMGSGLYEAAFSTLVRLYGQESRSAITGVTLFAGFASTVGWPLSTWLEAHVGWSGACFAWAGLHLLLGLPLNAWLPGVMQERDSPARADTTGRAAAATPDVVPAHERLNAALLAFTFACVWFVSTAMAAHLPRMLQAAGASLVAAVGVGALVGPAQVAGRVVEFTLLRRVHPLLAARLAALAHPLGAALLLAAGASLAPVFALLHGAGNGILTIAMGTLPLVLFGARGYGARQGWLMLPARGVQALAPLLFGMALDGWGAAALWLSLALGLCAFSALLLMRSTATQPQAAAPQIDPLLLQKDRPLK